MMGGSTLSPETQGANLYKFVKPLVGLLIVWELIAQTGLISEQALPHVYEVITTFISLAQEGALHQPAQTTYFRALAAFSLAVTVGVIIGLLMARIWLVDWFFDPMVSIGFPLPKATLVPIFILWFGFGTPSAILLAATAAVFPVIIATRSGAQSVDQELIWSVRSMGVSKIAATWKVILPAALPQIFNGIQIAVFLSVTLTLVTEMVSSGGGLGEQLVLSVRFFRTPDALSYLFVAIVLGVVTDRIFRVLRAYILRWTE